MLLLAVVTRDEREHGESAKQELHRCALSAADVPKRNRYTHVGIVLVRLETPYGCVSSTATSCLMMEAPMFGKASRLQPRPIMRLVAICFLGSAAAACETGNGASVDAARPPPSEAGNTQLGIICSTFYSSAGTFAPNTGDPPPTGFSGCWPIGVWTFSLTMVAPSAGSGSACAGSNVPTPLTQYEFTGTTTTDQDGDPEEVFTYNPQPDDPNVNNTIKVTEGGSGLCQGDVSLYDTTGTKVWTLSPELNADNSITGTGTEYDLYGTDQWGGSD
jgi:hypothetical protein